MPLPIVKKESDFQKVLAAAEKDLEQGDLIAARNKYETILGLDSTNVEAYLGLGQIAFQRGFVDDAEILFGEAYEVGLEKFSGELPKSLSWDKEEERSILKSLHGQGLVAYRKGDISSASKWFDSYISLNPADDLGANYFIEAIQKNRKWHELG